MFKMASKSCKYNKYPEPSSIKTALFMDYRGNFAFPSTKTHDFMDSRLIFDTLAKKTGVFLAGK